MKFERNNKRKIRASVEMTPLIDVVFLLLIFFMLSSTFVVQTSIPIETPVAEGAEKLEQKELAITLAYGEGGPDNEGAVYVDDTAINDWAELSRVLAEFNARRPDGLVLIRPDARISTGRTVRVLGIVNTAGIRQYGIAAEPPQQEE